MRQGANNSACWDQGSNDARRDSGGIPCALDRPGFFTSAAKSLKRPFPMTQRYDDPRRVIITDPANALAGRFLGRGGRVHARKYVCGGYTFGKA